MRERAGLCQFPAAILQLGNGGVDENSPSVTLMGLAVVENKIQSTIVVYGRHRNKVCEAYRINIEEEWEELQELGKIGKQETMGGDGVDVGVKRDEEIELYNFTLSATWVFRNVIYVDTQI
ncbi:hypothetical protein JEQ12_017579 [Ovis aries]|uniref:Uncharacterized protein n=1 Tax=Ovis aries TaxID=9940 RepID=A0A836D4R7_SHEEP|nr:hypothetical protein JEQ12_017579 [Ovis aries]